MNEIKKAIAMAVTIVLSLIAFNASAQHTEVTPKVTEQSYNSRLLYMRASYGIGGGDWSTQGFGLGIFGKLNQRLYTGVSGFYYGNPPGFAGIQQIIPVSAELHYEIGTSGSERAGILVGTAIGYNFVLDGETQPDPNGPVGEIKDGFYLNPSIGYRFNLTKNTGVVIDLGYQLVQGRELDVDTKDLIKDHIQHNILLKANLFF